MKNISISKFLTIHKKILIYREFGGLGDILMIRMIFEDVKIKCPNCWLVFACPNSYFYALQDHPFLDELIDIEKINFNEYISIFNISTACTDYELSIPKPKKHRADIWSESMGLPLTRHNMHLMVSDEEIEFGLSCKNKKPLVYLAPISNDKNRSLSLEQINDLLGHMKKYDVKIVHNRKIDNLNIESNLTFNQMKGLMHASDFVISVDTSHFHLAQALKKPTLGIFSWTSGETVGKYHDVLEIVQKEMECSPCYRCFECPITQERIKPCMGEITGKEIFKGFKKLVNKKIN